MSAYDSSSIRVLEPNAESVGKRPQMFFGNIDSYAANQVVYEVVANSIDQYISGHATKIKVECFGRVIRVSDDGLGMPFDKNVSPESDLNLVEYCFTQIHATATADGHAPHVHINPKGIGLSAVNAVCDRVDVDTSNTRLRYQQCFGKGRKVTNAIVVDAGKASGTVIEFSLV